jgi:hypothetical protein
MASALYGCAGTINTMRYTSAVQAVVTCSVQFDCGLKPRSLLLLLLQSPLFGLGRFFSFLILYTVGRASLMGDQPVSKLLSTHRTTQRQNKCSQTSMPRVEFESTIPVFQRTKTIHALDRAATVIGESVIK